MNKRITKLFSVCLNNRVVVIETNFSQFYDDLKAIEPNCNSDRWYIERFKESSEFSHIIDGKEYFFQKLV